MSLFSRFWSTDRSLTALLVWLVIFIFVIEPLGKVGIVGRVVFDLALSLMLLSGMGAIAKGVVTTAAVGSLVVAGLTVHWVHLFTGMPWLAGPDACLCGTLCAVLAAIVLAQVFREGPITSKRIQGAIAVYLLLGVAWAFAYDVIVLWRPQAFTVASASLAPNNEVGLRFLYFSFVTLTTVGYGDVVPVHPFARSFANAEGLVGQLFPAILLARLVSMELYYRQEARARHG